MSVSIYDQETQSTIMVASKTGLPTTDAQPIEGSCNPITSDWAYMHKSQTDAAIEAINNSIAENKKQIAEAAKTAETDSEPVSKSAKPIASSWAYDYKSSTDKKISDIQSEINTSKQGSVTTVPLASFTGNLTKIVTSVIDGPDGTITYAVKNGLCHINFSFAIAGKAVTLRTADRTTDVSNALWLISSVKLPKPLQMARGQAMPVNSGDVGTANLKVEEDGTLQVLINNYHSAAGQWYQGGMSYIINEEETAEG